LSPKDTPPILAIVPHWTLLITLAIRWTAIPGTIGIYALFTRRTIVIGTTDILLSCIQAFVLGQITNTISQTVTVCLAVPLLTYGLIPIIIYTYSAFDTARVITADIAPEPVIHTFTTLTIQRIFTIAIGSANISFIYALTNIQIAEKPLFTLFIYLALLPIAPIPLITLTIVAELIFITICI